MITLLVATRSQGAHCAFDVWLLRYDTTG